MANKTRVNYKDVKAKGTLTDQGTKISAGVWGQLRPLDEKAREKIAKWGDTLPNLVSPDLAGRFEAAYEALRERVDAEDVVGEIMDIAINTTENQPQGLEEFFA